MSALWIVAAVLWAVPPAADASYASRCAGCHQANGTPDLTPEVDNLPDGTGTSGSIRAANNRTYLDTKIDEGMGGFTLANFPATERNTLVAEIGNSNSVAIPVITSTAPPGGNYNNAYSKQVTATSKPSLNGPHLPSAFSISTGALPTGLSINPQSGLISGTPTNANFETAFTGTIRVDNKIGVDTQAFSIVISRDTQTITFNAQTTPTRTFVPGGTFSINPTATASSGLSITYTSDFTSNCTVSGTTVTMVSAGSCTIRANRDASANYEAATDQTETVTINPGNPNINLPVQSPATQAFRPNSTFLVNPIATSPSPVAITYTVSPASVCTNSGTTITKVGIGNCAIVAHQVSNADWNADDSLTRTVVIGQAIQVLTFPAQVPASYTFTAGTTFQIDPATSQASTTSGNPIVYSSLNTGVCTVSGTTVTMVNAGTCQLAANQAGNTNYAAAAQVTQNVVLAAGVPGAPTLTAVIGGDTRATLVFTPPANPGSPITSFTATCTIGGGSITTGSFSASPVIVTGLTNGAPWTCSVTATNAIGTGGASSVLAVTPSPTTVAALPVWRSSNSATFTIGTPGSFRVVATGVPNPTYSRSGVALPSGVLFPNGVSQSGTAIMSGTPALGSAGSYIFTFTATNASGSVNQTFTLTIAKAAQTITFSDPVDRAFNPATFALTATASSGLAASFTSSTTPICTVTSAGVVTMVTVGTCTIVASQPGDANYLAATSVPQSFQISQANQTISWATLPTRTFVDNGTFTLSPLASASSGLPITYSSFTPTVCDISGITVTMFAASTCILEATQVGNANYFPESDVLRAFPIQKASQTITFPVQAAQPFSAGGTFPISPLATGGASGLPVIYSSLTTGVCTISGITVTIVSVGSCTIAANQAGDSDYLAAPQVTRTIAVNAVVPDAPVADSITGSDAKATIAITPPSFDGGSPITGYTATCNPGNRTGNAVASPVVVTGLTNNVQHTCTVVANNAQGSSAPSNAIMVTPFLDDGPSLWDATCSGCHGTPPGGTRFNAAGDTSTVLLHVRATVPEMLAQPTVQALTANELAEIAKYIKQQLTAISADTPYQTAVQIDVGFPKHITLSGISFTGVQSVTPPTNGILSAFSGTTVTYTPNPGFAGTDTFTYRGFRTGPTVLGEPRTVTVNVLVPGAPPVITSVATANGVFGQAFNYQITATNGPASFGASNLAPGLSVNTVNGAITGIPTAGGVFNATISASNPNPSSPGSAGLTITISAANQTITFGAQGNQGFAPGGMFGISPLAAASSNLTVTYSSLTMGVCTVSGTQVTMVTAGTCTVAANQAGNGNYNAALQVTRDITINPALPGAPTIGTATPGNNQATIAFTPPANNGGSPIIGYNANCSGAMGSNTVSPITITGLTNGTLYSCSVTATNSVGTGPPSGTVMVTPTATPVPPAITSANATTFTVLSFGTFNVTATGTPNPGIALTSGTLPSGVTFNAGVLSGTPATGTAAASPYPLTFTASSTTMPDAMQSFTLTVAKINQTITFANPGPRSFSVVPFTITPAPVSSAGLTVVLTSNSPGVCTVSGNDVTTLTTGVCSISANVPATADVNAANTVTNAFSINPANQTINFGAQTSPRDFSTSPFALNPVAFATSALGIVYSTTTPSICVMSGNNVATLAAGLCTVAANQPGNANYAAAVQVTQDITINAVAPGAPAIGIATGSDMQVNIAFTAPASNGGSPITAYNVTCTPSGAASGPASPVAVTGLTNGTPYTCSVKAANAPAGEGAASGNVMVTPTSANGAALWTAVCDACHTQVPAGNQLNGAGSTAAVLNFVRANQPLMMFNTNVQNLSQAELAAIAAYIGNVVPVNEVTTAFNTAAPIDVASHLKFTGQAWSAFTEAELVTPPANGMLSAFTGTTATYTPSPGFTGVDSFTYRGKRSSPSVIGDPRTVTITVQGAVPSITSAATVNGIFGQAVNYQIVATNSPTSFGAANLPAALVVDTGSGAITGLPSAAGMFNVTLSATNGSGTGNAPLSIVIAQASQTITFGAQTSPRAFNVGSFGIAPLASGGLSGNPLVYASTTPSVCAVDATTVTIVAAGLCTIGVNQAGDNNYSAAAQVTQNVTIDPSAPGAPTIGTATPGNAQATVSFTPPSNTGGAGIGNFTVTCGGISVMGGSSPISVTGLANGVSVACSVTATGPGGTSGASATVNVTPNAAVVPGAPTIGVATPGNGQATIAFTPPMSDGGSPITGYTATCSPGGLIGVDTVSPITVSGLTNGATYSCVVAASNAVGPGPNSASVDVTLTGDLLFIGAQSRKTHGVAGTFDLAIDTNQTIGDPVTVEPRIIGGGHLIVFQFNNPVTATGTVAAVGSTGAPIGSASVAQSGNEAIVTLTGVADNSRATISLTGVNGALNPAVSIGFLIGDVNNTRSVTASDISGVKARSGQTTTGSNFKFDVNVTGAISASDISAVKARSGLTLAP